MIYYNVANLIGELKRIKYELVGAEVLFDILEKVKHKKYKVQGEVK